MVVRLGGRTRMIAGFGVSILALSVFLVVFDVGAMLAELEGVSLLPFLAGFAAVFLAILCWAESMRRVLIAAGGDLPPHRGFLGYAAGMFAKQVVPLGNAGGVPIMAYAIDREADIGFNRSMAVVTVGDFLGLLSSLVLAVAGVTYVLLLVPGTRVLRAAFVAVAIFAAGLVSVAILLLYRRDVLRYVVLGVAHFLRRTLGALSGRIEARLAPASISASVDRYFETFDTVRGNRRSVAVAAALALVGWTAFALPLYTSSVAVGHPIHFGIVLFIIPIGGIATLVPLPGGLGGVEFAIAGMIVAMTGVELAVAGAIVLLYRACVYWFPVFVGLLAVIYSGTSLQSLEDGVDELPGVEPEP